ncbi:MAG: hypothetical protein L3J07_00930 [Candidatus Magasanikbacteria bacterium]|nr:hypothetical protein [Candidatus Magasanikbacteria bacterium]
MKTYAKCQSCQKEYSANELQCYGDRNLLVCEKCLKDPLAHNFLEASKKERMAEEKRLADIRRAHTDKFINKAIQNGGVVKKRGKKSKRQKKKSKTLKAKNNNPEDSDYNDDQLMRLFSCPAIRESIEYFLGQRQHRIDRVFAILDNVGTMHISGNFLGQNYLKLENKPSGVLNIPFVIYHIITTLDSSDAREVFGSKRYNELCNQFEIR